MSPRWGEGGGIVVTCWTALTMRTQLELSRRDGGRVGFRLRDRPT